MKPKTHPLSHALTAMGLCVAYVVLLVRSTADLGYARDEGFYFQASSSYGRWFELFLKDRHQALDPRTIDVYWGINHEHPGLIKSLFALSNLFLQQRHHLFAMDGTSFRFPAMVLAGLGVALVYLWGAQARGRVAGLAAAIALAAMPRFFFQSHLACFDIPIVTMWTCTAYCYWRTLKGTSTVWPLLTGLSFGLALDTKHNSWFLPICFLGHVIGRELLRLLDAPKGKEEQAAFSASRRRSLQALLAMAVFGPLVLYTLWPWIWKDTLVRLQNYAQFHLNHEYYNMEFLGKNYWAPPMPRGYAWVMTVATVPAVTLLLFVTGLFSRARARLIPLASRVSSWASPRLGRAFARLGSAVPRPRFDPASTDLLWLLALLINYAAWLNPKTPIFGGTKHWMTAYPFLALFAGAGFDAAVRAARRELLRHRRTLAWAARSARRAAPVALIFGAAVFVAPVAETVHSHPYGLSSYSPLVGGAAGAATLGLNRGFWGYTTGAVAAELNKAPKRSSVYIHDTAGQAWDMLLNDGRIRRDIRGVWSIAGADYGLYHHEKHMLGQEYQNWVAFGTVRPEHIGGIDGVPVIVVYKQPRR